MIWIIVRMRIRPGDLISNLTFVMRPVCLLLRMPDRGLR